MFRSLGRVGAGEVVEVGNLGEDVWKRLAACDLKLNCHQDDQGGLEE